MGMSRGVRLGSLAMNATPGTRCPSRSSSVSDTTPGGTATGTTRAKSVTHSSLNARWKCNDITNGNLSKCSGAKSNCEVCSCVKGYVITCGSETCKHTDSRLTAQGRRRIEALEEILGSA